jgi:multicomponent Na+:H+ antiporter subunit E
MTLTSLISLSALWWLLAEGDPGSWAVGIPAIAAALVVRRRLNPFPAARVSPAGIVRFIAFFFRASLVGGVDVVWRAFHPRRPLTPGLVDYTLRLRSPAERVLAAGTVSLLPGSLSAALDHERLAVHALDLDLPVTRQLEELEARIAGLNLYSADPVSAEPDDHE